MINNRLQRRTAGKLSQGGFTLVELLVVIGIIAILAGVALGPITNGIKKAKQSGGLQSARTIALSEFAFANDHDSTYPDTTVPAGNTGTAAAAVIQPLVQGGYVSDPSIFYISGSSFSKFTGTDITQFQSGSSSWDFAGRGGPGLNTNSPDAMPVVWSAIAGGTNPDLATASVAVVCKPSATAPFGVDGVAIAFKNNGSKFIIPTGPASARVYTMVDATYPGCASAAPLLGALN